jgi:hypothetical protein
MKHQPITRHFAFLYPDDPHVQELLDIAIFVLNPLEKLSAHVTVAGPFGDVKELPREVEFCRKVCVFGAGEFRSSQQNTIHLRVDARDLEEIWDKPDVPYNPHMTIYDGDDKELADRLYEALFQLRLYFCFFVSRVTHVSLVKGQGSLDLMARANFSLVPELRKKTLADIKAFSREERILVAVEALKRAKYWAHRSGSTAEPARALG